MADLRGLANKRLVIFGCGYVGREIAHRAGAAGMRVEALTRNPDRASELSAAGVTVVVADLASDGWHERIAPGADVVVNCVGSGGGSVEDYRRSYVEGMRSVLSWARRGSAGTIVYTSSTSVYPQGGGRLVDEEAATGGGGTSALLLEAEALLADSGAGCRRWFILRLAGIYGPGRHHLLDQLRAGVPRLPGGGDHRLNLAHRDDICAAVFAVGAAPAALRNRIYNVADDAPAPRAEVVGWLAKELGCAPPGFEGGAASRRGGFTAPRDRIISNRRLKLELGWQPRYPSYREGYAAILSA